MISYVSYLKCLRLKSMFSASGYSITGRFFRTHSEQANLNSIENPHGTWKWMKTMICNSGISVSRGHIFRQHSWSQLMVTHLRFIHMESWDSLKLAYCSAMTSNAPTVSFLRTMWEETQATKKNAFEGAGSLRHHFSCNNVKIKHETWKTCGMPLGLTEVHICRSNDQQVGHGAQLRQDLHLVLMWENGMACDIWQGIVIVYPPWNSRSPLKSMVGKDYFLFDLGMPETNQLRLVVFSQYLQGFIHPRWLFGISSINSMLVSGRDPGHWLLDPGHWLVSWPILSKIDGVVRSNVENREPRKFVGSAWCWT